MREFPDGQERCECEEPEPTPAIKHGLQPYPAEAWLRCVTCWGLF